MNSAIRVVWVWLWVCLTAFAEHAPIRCLRDAKAQLTCMQTAITRFKHPTQGYSVDLVAAVHVGPRTYYGLLNKSFRQYDAVLYELIADSSEGRPIPERGGGNADNPLSWVQHGLSDALGLEFQLDHVDYAPPNFVHADISPQEFKRSMTRRKESFAQVLMRSMQHGSLDNPEAEKELEQVNFLNLLGKGPSQSDRVHLRRSMALMFAHPEVITDLMEGPGGSTLVSVRNKKALKVLRQQLGKGKRKLAIFYGAAHMTDMEKRLVDNFGVKFAGQSWLSAWDLRLEPTK